MMLLAVRRPGRGRPGRKINNPLEVQIERVARDTGRVVTARLRRLLRTPLPGQIDQGGHVADFFDGVDISVFVVGCWAP